MSTSAEQVELLLLIFVKTVARFRFPGFTSPIAGCQKVLVIVAKRFSAGSAQHQQFVSLWLQTETCFLLSLSLRDFMDPLCLEKTLCSFRFMKPEASSKVTVYCQKCVAMELKIELLFLFPEELWWSVSVPSGKLLNFNCTVTPGSVMMLHNRRKTLEVVIFPAWWRVDSFSF